MPILSPRVIRAFGFNVKLNPYAAANQASANLAHKGTQFTNIPLSQIRSQQEAYTQAAHANFSRAGQNAANIKTSVKELEQKFGARALRKRYARSERQAIVAERNLPPPAPPRPPQKDPSYTYSPKDDMYPSVLRRMRGEI